MNESLAIIWQLDILISNLFPTLESAPIFPYGLTWRESWTKKRGQTRGLRVAPRCVFPGYFTVCHFSKCFICSHISKSSTTQSRDSYGQMLFTETLYLLYSRLVWNKLLPRNFQSCSPRYSTPSIQLNLSSTDFCITSIASECKYGIGWNQICFT